MSARVIRLSLPPPPFLLLSFSWLSGRKKRGGFFVSHACLSDATPRRGVTITLTPRVEVVYGAVQVLYCMQSKSKKKERVGEKAVLMPGPFHALIFVGQSLGEGTNYITAVAGSVCTSYGGKPLMWQSRFALFVCPFSPSAL